jgi:hypothetical protein
MVLKLASKFQAIAISALLKIAVSESAMNYPGAAPKELPDY